LPVLGLYQSFLLYQNTQRCKTYFRRNLKQDNHLKNKTTIIEKTYR